MKGDFPYNLSGAGIYFCAMKILGSCFFIAIIAGCSSQPSNNPSPAGVDKPVAFEEGKTIFTTRCASCHMVNKEMTGPALRGVEDRWPDRKKLYACIRNSEELIKTDAYAHNLWMQYNQTPMNKHLDLTDAQIEQVLGYINSVSVKP